MASCWWSRSTGSLGQSAEWDPVPEPGMDAGGVTGGEGDPASPLRSRTHGSLSYHMEVPPGKALPSPQLFPVPEPSWNPRGLERGKHTSRRGKSSQRSSPVLKELVKEMEKAARGTGRATVQKEALKEGSSHIRHVFNKETQAKQATGMPGVDAGKNTRAAVDDFLRSHYTPMIALLVAALLSGLVVTCIAVSWMWREYSVHKREETAPGQGHPDSEWERGRTGGEAELQEAAKEDVLARENKNLCSGSSPFPCSQTEFDYLCSKISTDPSLWPACPSSSPMDSVSSPDTRSSRGSP